MTNSIRVLQVITRLNIGGPALIAMLLAERLDDRRYDTMIICGEAGPREGDLRDLRPTGSRVLQVPGLVRAISPTSDARTLFGLIHLFRRLRPMVVHTHLAKAGALGRLAARVAGVPIVVHTFHGTVFEGYFDPVRSRGFALAERGLARLADGLIAISARQRDDLIRKSIAAPERITVIPVGVDLEPFVQASAGSLRAELGVTGSTVLVGIVARLVAIKAVDTFIAMAAAIARARADVLFIVVGRGELEDDLRRQAQQLGLGERIRFLGGRADLPSILADLDIVVLTSRNEGTPLALIEALASGRAVVATAVGGVPDVLDHGACGVLVEPNMTEALIEATLSLVDDPSRRERLGSAGRSRALTEHSADAMVARVARLYEELIERRRGFSVSSSDSIQV